MDYWNKYQKYKTKYLNLKLNQIGRAINYDIFVREPWYSLIKKGIKSVEGRLNKGLFSKIQTGDVIVWKTKNDKDGIKTQVVKKIIYKSFKEMIEKETIEKILPKQNFTNIEQGIQVYREWYSEADEIKYGVVGIHLEVLNDK